MATPTPKASPDRTDLIDQLAEVLDLQIAEEAARLRRAELAVDRHSERYGQLIQARSALRALR